MNRCNCICMMHSGPIRPPATSSPSPGAQASDSDFDQAICRPCSQEEMDDDPVNPKHALFGDPIVGVENVILDENGVGARGAQPLPAPKGMTAAAWERHCSTHLPYCSSCPWCVAARRANVQHRPSHEHRREVPLLVGDYCFLKCSDDASNITVLVLRVYPYRISCT